MRYLIIFIVLIAVIAAMLKIKKNIPKAPKVFIDREIKRKLSKISKLTSIDSTVDDMPWGLSTPTIQALQNSALEILDGRHTSFGDVNPYTEYFEAFFAGDPHPENIIKRVAEEYEKSLIKYQRADWSIAFTSEFIKAIAHLDRKLQGRLLEALSHLAMSPIQQQGDTVKPLIGDLKGLWRYRIGDYRLIYLPDSFRREIVLMSFDSRGQIYRTI